MECSGVLPTTKFANQKGLGTCDALLCISHTLQSALESGLEARIMQIDFNAAFDRVNHQEILYRLRYVGILGSVLSMLIQFQSNQSQHVMVNGCQSKLTGQRFVRNAAGQCFGPVIVSPVNFRVVIVLPVHFGTFFHSGK